MDRRDLPMKEADGTSGGRTRRRATGRKETVGGGDEDAARFDECGQKLNRPRNALRRRRGQQLAVGDVLDHALMLRRVGILVKTMVQGLRRRQRLQRDIKRQHQPGGEQVSSRARSSGGWPHHHVGSQASRTGGRKRHYCKLLANPVLEGMTRDGAMLPP